MATWRQRIGAYISKAFRLGPAVVEAADVAFGTDPEKWSPEVYGNYIATSSAVYACVNLRARNIASLPLLLYRDGKILESGALHDLLRTVNPHWTPNRLWQMTTMALDLWGEAFWVLERGQDGQQRPKEIWWARPDRMRMIPDEKNYLAGWIYEWNNQRLAFSPGEVIWFRNPNPIDEFEGLSPIAATRLALDTGHAALRSNNAVFTNGTQLSGVVTPADKDLTWARDQVEALRDMLDRRFRGVDKAHRLAVLGQAATFTPMSISPKDAQFIELMKWTRSDACMVYGVPPELIGDQEGATYNNVQQAHTGFWTDTMIPLASMLAGELVEQLLPMFGGEVDHCDFDLSTVPALQADQQKIADQAKAWASMGVPLNAILKELAPQYLNNGEGWPWGDQPADEKNQLFRYHLEYGIVTVNEARQKLGLEPMRGGDVKPESSETAPAAKAAISMTPPGAVRAAARDGLRLLEAGKGGDGLQPQTIREARDMADGRAITEDKARRMVAWFARHESDKRPGWDERGKETPGFVAWQLWGGDAGRAWATRLVQQMDAEGKSYDATPAGIEYGSVDHKAAYEELSTRINRVMRSMQREITRLFEDQAKVIAARLRDQATKAMDSEADVDALWDEVTWDEIFQEAFYDQIQAAAEVGALATLADLKVEAGAWSLDAPEVQAALQARTQAFAVPVNDTTWNRLKASLMEGLANGEGTSQLEARVFETMHDRIQSSAETIARTEAIGAMNEGSLSGAVAAEARGLGVKKSWLATFDGRERDTHAAAHRLYQKEAIPLKESFLIGGVEFKSPGNPTAGRTEASASECINCRCSVTYQVQDDRFRGHVIQSDTVSKIAGWLDDTVH